MIRSSLGDDRYVVGENDYVLGTAETFAKQQPKAVLYAHGSGTNLLGVAGSSNQLVMLNALARHLTVHAGDYGLEAWGNDTGVARLHAAVTYLQAEWGVDAPVAIVAASMGFTNALNYARVHPENVTCIAGIIPCVDIKNIYDLGAQAVIDAAYPPTYNDATIGQTHSPIHIVENELIDDNLPIHLWTVPNDATTVPATADAFVATRPQTGRTILAPVGHTTDAVRIATPDVVKFVRRHT